MKQALTHLTEMGLSSATPTEGGTPEEDLQAAIEAAGRKPVDDCIIKALTYFRLRRNQVVHLRVESTDELKTRVRYQVTYLNQCSPKRGALDFSRIPSPKLGEAEAIDFIKLLRVYVQEIDRVVAGSLDPLRILKSLEAWPKS